MREDKVRILMTLIVNTDALEAKPISLLWLSEGEFNGSGNGICRYNQRFNPPRLRPNCVEYLLLDFSRKPHLDRCSAYLI